MFSYGVKSDSKFKGMKKIVSYVNPIVADLVGNSKFVSRFCSERAPGCGVRVEGQFREPGISGLGAEQI
jgi:hypothetical protein